MITPQCSKESLNLSWKSGKKETAYACVVFRSHPDVEQEERDDRDDRQEVSKKADYP